jgi:hypothetical protein
VHCRFVTGALLFIPPFSSHPPSSWGGLDPNEFGLARLGAAGPENGFSAAGRKQRRHRTNDRGVISYKVNALRLLAHNLVEPPPSRLRQSPCPALHCSHRHCCCHRCCAACTPPFPLPLLSSFLCAIVLSALVVSSFAFFVVSASPLLSAVVRRVCLFALARPLFCLLGQGAGMALAGPPLFNF